MGDIRPIRDRLVPVSSPRRVRKYDGRGDDDEKQRRRKRSPDAGVSADTPSESCETDSQEARHKNPSRNRTSEADDQPGGHVDVRV